MNTKRKSSTKRKQSATKGESEAVQRWNKARSDAQEATEAAGAGSYHETAGRITLILMHEETAASTRHAIQRALDDLAELTGVTVSHPTVICETYPTMAAAVSSGETWESKRQDQSAQERHAHLLGLLARAEAGETLDEPVDDTHPYEREGQKLCAILESKELSRPARDFFNNYLSTLAIKTGLIRIDDHTVCFDPTLLPILYQYMRGRDGEGDEESAAPNILISEAIHLMSEADAEIVSRILDGK
jgi:hypothetical protein